MICRLYGEETKTHFNMEWFPMEYTMVKTYKSLNGDNVLSFNIANQVLNMKGMKNIGFYMSSYLIDLICVNNYFPTYIWAWTRYQIPVHVYCSQLWDKYLVLKDKERLETKYQEKKEKEVEMEIKANEAEEMYKQRKRKEVEDKLSK
jgi:hypothetical protein